MKSNIFGQALPTNMQETYEKDDIMHQGEPDTRPARETANERLYPHMMVGEVARAHDHLKTFVRLCEDDLQGLGPGATPADVIELLEKRLDAVVAQRQAVCGNL